MPPVPIDPRVHLHTELKVNTFEATILLFLYLSALLHPILFLSLHYYDIVLTPHSGHSLVYFAGEQSTS
jgi:hypothetical protein